MRRIIEWIGCLLLVVNMIPLQAQTRVTAFYLPGGNSGVTYVGGPDTLKGTGAGEPLLIKGGNPLFFAATPDLTENKVGGSLLFREPGDKYQAGAALGGADDDFVLETWAHPAKEEDEGTHIVVTNGDGEEGYAIAQRDGQWVALVDGAAVAFTPRIRQGWTHLAIAGVGKELRLYLDGKLVNKTGRSRALKPVFVIGNNLASDQSFRGMIYAVRYSVIGHKLFDENKDLLLNYGVLLATRKTESKERKELLANISRPGLGVVLVREFPEAAPPADWLVKPVHTPARLLIQRSDSVSAKMRLTNGLVSRDFYVGENLACYSLKNITNGAEYLRAVKPEARVRLDSTWFDIGGLKGQPEKSYLLESWLGTMMNDPGAFRFTGLRTAAPAPRYTWQQRYHAAHADWPPKGLHVIMTYQAPDGTSAAYKGTVIEIHYEIYEGVPVMAKWLTVKNSHQQDIIVDETETEVLAVAQDQITRIQPEGDYSFALANADPRGSALMHYTKELPAYQAGRGTTDWRVDAEYNTWATHNQAEDRFLNFPHHNLLISRVPMGPAAQLMRDSTFNSFITFELLHDDDDRERQALAHRKFYRTLAPQVSESLLTAAITSQDAKQIKGFIDQMSELGFECLDIQPWPEMEQTNLDPAYVAKWKDIAGYAGRKGIIMGGYELEIASKDRGAEVDVVDAVTNKPGSVFGQSVCVASKWADDYFPKLFRFFDETGFRTYNMDGPYHGDACAATYHAHHLGLMDSQWQQWKKQVSVLHELLNRNVYIPIPDWYFLNGSSTTSMGYREASANLTPDQQLLLGRQYIYDGTWHKAPTMGWISLQLVGFYTNDPKVGLEPLKDNLSRYEKGLFQYLAAGCHFTVRGNRLYDAPETKSMVLQWTTWFKQHREILTSDIIHLGRPTGRGLDCLLHVNPALQEKGMAILFNPTEKAITQKVRLPLYYTGIKKITHIKEKGGTAVVYNLNDKSEVFVSVNIPAGGYTWLVIE